jgi:2-oxoacid dehydrogenases acyltransferase (catalytic domain)
VMARSVAARQHIGTVAVTAVGMFAGGGGFGITSLSLMSLEVIVGGMSQRPRVVDGQVTVRDVLDLTVVIDHNVVDGAPAARFTAEFRELLESAAVLSSPSVALQALGSGTWPSVRRYRRGRPDPFRTAVTSAASLPSPQPSPAPP